MTFSAPPWELLGGLLTGLAALVTALVGVARVISEIRDLRQRTDKAARDTAEVLAQQHTNGGSSLRDDVKRILVMQQRHGEALTVMQETQRRQESEAAQRTRQLTAMGERMTMDAARTGAQLEDIAARVRKLEQPSVDSLPRVK